MVSRPSDWSVVGWDCDPTPGDPVVVRAGGEHYQEVAAQLRRAAATVRRLHAGASSGSESVVALLENSSELAEKLDIAQARYQVAGDALVDYAYALDRIQSSTEQALVVAKAARAEADECRRLAKLYRRFADEATDLEVKSRYERLEATKLVEESDAEARVSAQKQVVSQGVTDQLVAGDRASALIGQVTSTDGLNDSWRDDVLAALKVFAHVIEIVSTVLGVLALVLCWVPILGQALMVLAAIAGIITALANIVLAASGEISWTEAIISIGFAVLGCVGLGGLKGAFTALRAGGKLLTSGKALAGVFKTGGTAVKATFARLVSASAKSASGGRSVFMKAGDNFAKFTSKTAPQDGYYDVVIHGSATDFGRSPESWIRGQNFDHRQLANMITHDPEYTGGPIRLLSCHSGELANRPAQNLANKLGVDVMAANNKLWAFEDGRLAIGPFSWLNTGEFLLFRPGNVNPLMGG